MEKADPESPSSSPAERTAATALLQLRSSSSSSSIFSDDLNSGTSSCISELSSSEAQIHADPLQMLAFAACLNRIKPKVAKKARSKTHHKKKFSSVTTEASASCASSRVTGRSGPEVRSYPLRMTKASCASSRVTGRSGPEVRSYPLRMTKARCRSMKMTSSSTTRGDDVAADCVTSGRSSCYVISSIERRAAEIVALLSSGVGWYSEFRIRAAVGDSPDTSKALRMLLKKGEVKRSGAGGHVDPFVYTVASSGTHSDVSFLNAHARKNISVRII